ncbi:PilN domain-containing protein [Pelomonas sp. SE-A7]|uniref:PilN domain-containing protein n=1 Tax=Pelomonas sp. SE-A7 TaxID=3054953 RepID=UPI00259CEE46|nr:PilN domain-containing protein [Pelomonas sp. SE-A7]MDM4767780.1 hypothetical protein [Pelomonas sp. SE-A7]
MSLSPQHINLLDASLLPPKARYTAVQGLVAAALLIAAVLAAGLGLRWAAAGEAREALALQQQLRPLQAQLATPLPQQAAAEAQARQLESLRQEVAALGQLQQVLQGGSAGSTRGYADYLLALSRQAARGGGQLWITGFKVLPDGQLEVHGRMLDARALPEYLRRLNEEPLFRGRSFAQLNVKAGESFSEFQLQAAVEGAKP